MQKRLNSEYVDLIEKSGRFYYILNDKGISKIKELYLYNSSDDEVADYLKIPYNTLINNNNKKAFIKAKEDGISECKFQLRKIQMSHAKRNPSMAIFLGRELLSQERANEESKRQEEALNNISEKLLNFCNAKKKRGDGNGK